MDDFMNRVVAMINTARRMTNESEKSEIVKLIEDILNPLYEKDISSKTLVVACASIIEMISRTIEDMDKRDKILQ